MTREKSVAKLAEHERLRLAGKRVANWQRWGPYLSERQWGTVREDYSTNGNPWPYFPHDHARSRAYRWGEDGLLGITDRQCRLCFALVVVPVQTTLALALAVLLSRGLRGMVVFRTLFFMPVVFPMALVAIVRELIHAPGPTGTLNTFLEVVTLGWWAPRASTARGFGGH